MARPAISTNAILLRSVAYGEADRIVTLLTDAHGIVALIARSARRSQKRFAGSLEPFALIEAEVALGGGEVGRLAGARLVRGYPKLLSSLSRMEMAGAGLELVREIVPPREPEALLVPTVVRFFDRLEADDAGPEARIAFELRLLAIVGLEPRLDACGRCGRGAAERAALFDAALGAIVCRACGGGPVHLHASTRARMMACARERWDETARGWDAREIVEAEAVLDAFVQRQIGKARAGGGSAEAIPEARRDHEAQPDSEKR